jgi:hypothetical protein
VRLNGSCHCGAVRFTLESPHPYPFNLCYCSICRKTSGGGGFAINLSGIYETLKIEGRDNLRVYQAMIQEPGDPVPHQSPGMRHFCSLCGSPLWMWDPRWPELVHPLASSIDTPLPVPPERMHNSLESKPSWVPVHADPQDGLFQKFSEESIADWHERHDLVDGK